MLGTADNIATKGCAIIDSDHCSLSPLIFDLEFTLDGLLTLFFSTHLASAELCLISGSHFVSTQAIAFKFSLLVIPS